MRILITCPPMIKQVERYDEYIRSKGFDYFCPNVTQTLSEEELITILPEYDGWIIGDDPATRRVLEAGVTGRLKACIKWGVGTDNVDFKACKDLGIPVTNTPNMFGNEVADVAVAYLIGLARDIFYIDAEVKKGNWVKPAGISLERKKVCVVGFGDIGQNVAKRLIPFGLDIYVSDPAYTAIGKFIYYNKDGDHQLVTKTKHIKLTTLEDGLKNADFVVVCCSLNKSTYHLLDEEKLLLTKPGLRLINVSRGPVVDEEAVVSLQRSGQIISVAFDVFENEPLPESSGLRDFNRNIFGTHNCSNTVEAVDRTSFKTVNILDDYLKSRQ